MREISKDGTDWNKVYRDNLMRTVGVGATVLSTKEWFKHDEIAQAADTMLKNVAGATEALERIYELPYGQRRSWRDVGEEDLILNAFKVCPPYIARTPDEDIMLAVFRMTPAGNITDGLGIIVGRRTDGNPNRLMPIVTHEPDVAWVANSIVSWRAREMDSTQQNSKVQ